MAVIKSLIIKVFMMSSLDIIATTLFMSHKYKEGFWWLGAPFYATNGVVPMILFIGSFSTSVMLFMAIWKMIIAVVHVKDYRFLTVVIQATVTLVFCYFAVILNLTIANFLATAFGFGPFGGQRGG